MQIILLGIIAVIGIVAFLIYKKRKAKTILTSWTCSSCGAHDYEELSKIRAERDLRSIDGDDYNVTVYNRCKGCRKETESKRFRIRCKYHLNEDVIKGVREYLKLVPLQLPYYKIEIDHKY